jgi:hypothetical protein
MDAVNTPDRINTRDGHGRFRRQPANVERDARAARLAAQGWTYEAIATELDYTDRGAAWKAVQRVLIETARAQGTEELRVQQLAELAELRRTMWRTVDMPPPLVDKVGRIVRDDDGAVVPDEQARASAAMVIIRAGERAARLRGLDAPRRSVTASFSLADIQAQTEILRQELGLAANGEPPRVVLPGTAEAV